MAFKKLPMDLYGGMQMMISNKPKSQTEVIIQYLRKKKSINKNIRKSNNLIKKVKEQDNKEKLELKKYYNKVRSNIPSLLLVAVPIIVVLSTLIFLFKIII